MAEFDLKRVTPLEWAGVGAGALAFIVSFFPWYSVSYAGFGESLSAWNTGFLAWFSVLLLMAAGGLVLAPHFGTKVDRLPLIWLVLAAVATVFILLRWLTLPDDGGLGDLGVLGDSGFESGAGFGLIVGLLLGIVSTVAAVLTFRAAPKPVTGYGQNPTVA
ncbi:DUF5336 domain-containing protein [Actinophytocola oryzae]|uniref:Uncharacterized protein n=1 Tax=Actinophytocola oryzae TaxID=502181 RepID=A0A4V3FQI4_9PSEU|nr:DUF5336 domain-containing protein [Actinophytocola oryzae]TDV39791.1 hypothetical protein CLV71_125103 [Actinophytocola oryzae]